jgi:predicted lipoprotein
MRIAMTTNHRRAALSCLAVTAVLVACSRKGTGDAADNGPNAGSFDKAALLQAFGECTVGAYRDFTAASTRLEAATKKAQAEGTPDALAAARAAWNDAIDVWQRAEVLQIGPAAMDGAGAADMRKGIYAWPLVNRCVMDGQLVDKSYEKLEGTIASSRGLAAAEYLLFFEGKENGCGPQVTINTSGSWAALAGGQELHARRLAYAAAVSADVAARAQKLVDTWEPGKGDFLGTLAKAPNNTFTTQQMAFNAVSDAAYYVDDFVKTMKIGKPAGLTPDCTAAPCLDLVESPWAKRSKEHLKNNLAGFEALVRGCGAGGEGLGFDDLLVAVGAKETSDRLVASLNTSKAALAALTEPTFEEDLQKNPAGVKALFDALRAMFALMKSEVATVLDLNPPQRVASDND